MHEASGPAPPARAPFDISFTFMRLWLVHLVPSCSNSMQLAFQCSLSLACRKKKEERGRGVDKVKEGGREGGGSK